jgi:hypothetical protein
MNNKTIMRSLKVIIRKINKIECALLQTKPIVKKHTKTSFTHQTNNNYDDYDYDYDAYIQKIYRQGGL